MAVSVKNKMKTCLKQERLFSKAGRSYKPETISVSSDCHDGRWKSKMQSFNADVRNRILALVKAILEQNSITADVRPETRLVDAGLTSMDMVSLMLGVEAEFDFTIPQSEITPENFQSVKTLELMIVHQLQPEAAA
jgi:acyl carrier protein